MTIIWTTKGCFCQHSGSVIHTHTCCRIIRQYFHDTMTGQHGHRTSPRRTFFALGDSECYHIRSGSVLNVEKQYRRRISVRPTGNMIKPARKQSQERYTLCVCRSVRELEHIL